MNKKKLDNINLYQVKFQDILVKLQEDCKENKLNVDLAMDLCSKMEVHLLTTGLPDPSFDIPILTVRYVDIDNNSQVEKLIKVYLFYTYISFLGV